MEQPLSAATMMMSPDDMLRAYAERRRTGGGVMSPPGSPAPMSMPIPVPAPAPASTMSMPIPVTVPAPAATGSPVSSQMRVLYAPSSTSMNDVGAHRSSGSLSSGSGSLSGAGSGSDNNPFRKSMASKRVDTQCADEDAHFGDVS